MSQHPAPRAWQRMLSGRRLDLLHPDPADIAIEDLAHGLARVARWNGQTRGRHTFSVAQHSVLVEEVAGILDAEITRSARLAALLHDGPEYVIGDLISPFKAVLADDYKAVEQRLLAAIHRRFDLPPPDARTVALIKAADRVAAFVEAVQLAGFAPDEAESVFGLSPDLQSVSHLVLVPLAPDDAQRLFLARFTALAGPDT